MQPTEQVPRLIKALYVVVNELETLFPGRHFTPDGHLVGSLGEVTAAYLYDLELLPASVPAHDAKTRDGRLVQIKATQADRVALRSESDYLLVLRFSPDGNSQEIYNGPGDEPWKMAGPRQSNGQKQISLSRLRELSRTVSPEHRLQQTRRLETGTEAGLPARGAS